MNVNLSYSYAGGFGAGVNVGEGLAAGVSYNEKSGFGVSAGVAADGVSLMYTENFGKGDVRASHGWQAQLGALEVNYDNLSGYSASLRAASTMFGDTNLKMTSSLTWSEQNGFNGSISYNLLTKEQMAKEAAKNAQKDTQKNQNSLLLNILDGLGFNLGGREGEPTLFDNIQGAFSGAWHQLTNPLETLGNIGNGFSKLGKGLAGLASDAWDGISGLFGGNENRNGAAENQVIESMQNLTSQIDALEERKRQLNQVAGPYGSVSDLNESIEIARQIEFLRQTKVQNGISILKNSEIQMPSSEIEHLEETGQLDKVIGIYKKSGSEGLKNYIAGRASGFVGGALEGFFPSISDMAKNPAEAEAKLAKTIEFLKDKPAEFQAGFLEMRGLGELAGGILQGYALTKVLTLGNLGRSFSANDIPHSNMKMISSAEANEFFRAKGFSDPFAAGYNAYEITTSEAIKAVRVFSKDNPYGGFMTLPSEIAGKSATEIQKILGLQNTPTYKMTVEIPAGTRLIYGKVGPQPGWGQPGFGGNQIYLKDRIPMLNYKVLTTERLPY